ncbi:MAG: PD40 domain-containing protein [Acidobacteria bacterium]|nr:PD40 domain-containing protein [Acidobacteriota bacterium]
MRFLLVFALFAVGTVLLGQGVTLDTIGNRAKEKIAIPDFELKERSGVLNDAWSTINEVLKADLNYSGFLDILPPERVALVRSPHVGVNFEEWASIDAKLLVVGSIRMQDGQMVVEAHLYEVTSKQLILAKAYRGRPDLARKTAHVIADDIMTYLRNVQFANSKIIFSTEKATDAKRSRMNISELVMMDYDGFNAIPLTEGGVSMSPHAVRVGKETKLAYTVFENPNSFKASYGIYLKPTLLDRPRKLYGDLNKRATAPAISPDGNKIAFSIADQGNVDVYVMKLDGTDLVRITRHPAVDTNPSWAPGGKTLLFTSDRVGSPQIYAVDADGLNERRITYENPYNDSAVWNPHYDFIAYVSRFDNNFDIFVMDLRTGKNLRLTANQGSNEEPTWSPDGEHLCFTSNRTGSWQLYMVLRNGENLTQITRSGNNRNPVWVP